MKRILLLFAITIASITTTNAQEEDPKYGFSEKDVFITGSIGYNTVKQGDFKNSTFSFAPSVGYFISENISLGVGLVVSTTDVENSNNIQFLNIVNNSFGGSANATYFFTPKKQFSFFLGLGASYLHQKLTVSNSSDDVKANSFRATFSPGINYFLSENFSLNASTGALSYTTSKQDISGIDRQNQFGLNFNLSNINFGATYKF